VRGEGAKFYVPKKRFMGDNGSMIAYAGLVLVKAGVTVTTSLAKWRVRSGYRTDEVKVK